METLIDLNTSGCKEDKAVNSSGNLSIAPSQSFFIAPINPETMANFYNANENQGGDSNGFFGGGDGFSQPQQQQPPGGGNFAYGQQQPWSQSQSDPVHGAQPYGQYQQQQQQQPGIGFFSQQGMGNVMSNPNVMAAAATAMSGGLNSDTTFNMAGQAAEQIWQTGAGRIIPGLETLMLSLRRYFAVDNYYVKAKILKVLFPFRSKTWKRHVSTVVQ